MIFLGKKLYYFATTQLYTMSQSFTLLRNQINDAYDMIRPFTSDIIIRAISAMEEEEDERNVLLLSSTILRFENGLSSDVEIARDYIRTATGPSVQIFQEIIEEAEQPVVRPDRNNEISNSSRMVTDFFAMFRA